MARSADGRSRAPGQACAIRGAGVGGPAGRRRAVAQLGELCAALAVVTFRARQPRPGHRRRRTPPALPGLGPVPRGTGLPAVWRRYARALKQRNALLKARRARRAARCLGPRARRRRRAAHPLPRSATWTQLQPRFARAARRAGACAGREPARTTSPAGGATSCRWPTPCCWRAIATSQLGYTTVGPASGRLARRLRRLPGPGSACRAARRS